MEVINKTLNGLACLVGTLLRTSNISVPASARFEVWVIFLSNNHLKSYLHKVAPAYGIEFHVMSSIYFWNYSLYNSLVSILNNPFLMIDQLSAWHRIYMKIKKGTQTALSIKIQYIVMNIRARLRYLTLI